MTTTVPNSNSMYVIMIHALEDGPTWAKTHQAKKEYDFSNHDVC
jgi:hypothetical protein